MIVLLSYECTRRRTWQRTGCTWSPFETKEVLLLGTPVSGPGGVGGAGTGACSGDLLLGALAACI